jgi:hypothetical protein
MVNAQCVAPTDLGLLNRTAAIRHRTVDPALRVDRVTGAAGRVEREVRAATRL